jgi:hypothetical protein
VPAWLFGVAILNPASVRTTPRRTRIMAASTSMSRRRSSVSSPNRSAHHDASRIIARYRCGIASVSFASSSMDAGRIVTARFADPAARITHGFAAIFPSVTAVPMIVRRSP